MKRGATADEKFAKRVAELVRIAEIDSDAATEMLRRVDGNVPVLGDKRVMSERRDYRGAVTVKSKMVLRILPSVITDGYAQTWDGSRWIGEPTTRDVAVAICRGLAGFVPTTDIGDAVNAVWASMEIDGSRAVATVGSVTFDVDHWRSSNRCEMCAQLRTEKRVWCNDPFHTMIVAGPVPTKRADPVKTGDAPSAKRR